MLLSKLMVSAENNTMVISWYADNRSLELIFDGNLSLPGAADAAFASCLLPAMLLGQSVSVDDSFNLSPHLLKNLNLFQAITASWFDDVSQVELSVPKQQQTLSFAPAKQAVFFSGGVDASYSFFQLAEHIDQLIFCLGLDIQLHETDRVQQALQNARQFAQHYQKQLVVLRTNFRSAFPELSARRCQIVLLISYSLALGLNTLFVPASHDAKEMEPFRSHPMTDPLISNGVTRVEHHGMVSRVAKTVAIARSPQALAFLRVCNASEQFNCGECEKCLRTMATLAVLGKTSDSLPELKKTEQLRTVQIWTPGKFHMWHDIYNFAKAKGNQPIRKTVGRLCLRYQWRQLLKQFVRLSKQTLRGL